MNISYQEIIIFAVLALIVIAVIWLVVRIVKGFGSGYFSSEVEDARSKSPRR